MFKLSFVSLVLVLLIPSSNALAGINEMALDKIVITPNRYAQKVQNSAAFVKVISREDIENSNAQTLPEILRSQAGLVVRDYYGNGAKVVVDSRGFGETAASNTLVLIDGRRVNEIDLSGVDWAQIQLDNVEKIEIVHGPNSILYGDNAAGAVINIITKKGRGPAVIEFQATAGSFDMYKNRLALSGSKDSFSYFFSAAGYSIHGYRKNSDYRSSDFYSKLIYDVSDSFSLGFTCGFYEADFGLPGALVQSELALYSRRDSLFCDDGAGQRDWYVRIIPKFVLFQDNEFQIPLSFRKRSSDTYWGTGGYGVNSSNIGTFGISPKLVLNSKIYDKGNIFTAGVDFYDVDSSTEDFSSLGVQTGDAKIRKKSTGIFLQDELFLTDELILNFGCRWDKTKYDFDYDDLSGFYVDVDDLAKFDKVIYKAGLVYNYKQDKGNKSRVFFSISEGLRLAVVEEFMIYNFFVFPFGRSINQDLMPQESISYEGGISHYFGQKLLLNLTGYLMKIDDEIYYNPITYINDNYDKTERRGIELGIDWSLTESLNIFSNFAFCRAVFDSGAFGGNQIPAVPEYKATLGLNWRMDDVWKLNAFLNYMGESYFISDPQHNYPRMKDYATVDIKISYKFAESSVFMGINNLFDKKYSEYGAISFLGERGYYPSPGRNFTTGCSLKF